jgi:hypothetical protein
MKDELFMEETRFHQNVNYDPGWLKDVKDREDC